MKVLPIAVAAREGEYLPDYVHEFRQTVLRHLAEGRRSARQQ
jgi:hypothetical protein